MADSVKTKKKELVLGYSPYGYHGSIFPFGEVFSKGQDIKKDGFEGVDCVALWGGEDIHPMYYGQKHHPQNGASDNLSDRDVFEWKTILHCKKNNIPMLGVCRGAQFLCVGAGGSLVQHVSGHGYQHHVDTIHKKLVYVTSTHHQMMNPYNIEHTLIGWASPARAIRYEDGERNNIHIMNVHQEPEICYFPQLRGLAIQGHPEYSTATDEFRAYCNALIREFLFPAF